VTGLSGGIGTCYDFATVKYSGIVEIEEQRDKGPQTGNMRLTCIPNPFSTSTTIHLTCTGQSAERTELQIFDVAGRRVRDFILYPSSFILPTVVEWDAKGIPPGIYFISIDGSIQQKVMKIK
jgi:hypothetical protein